MTTDNIVGQCPVCRRNVYFMESHYIEAGIDYHESCFVKHLCIRKSKLESKKSKGSITLDEATELNDTDKMLINTTSTQEETTKYSPERKYDALICKLVLREECKRSNIERKMKLLEESRTYRWAWESFNIIENILSIDEKSESKQLIGDNNDSM